MEVNLQKIDLKKFFYSVEGFEIHDKIVSPKQNGFYIRFIDIIKELQNLKKQIDNLRNENLGLKTKLEENNLNDCITSIEKNEDLNSDKKLHAKVLDVYKSIGIGTILLADSISEGYIKPGYKYKNTRTEKVFEIKNLEDNFCPQFYKHPCHNISFSVKNVLITDFKEGDIIIPV